MRYVGMRGQQARNNLRSLLLLCLFPAILLGMVCAFFALVSLGSGGEGVDWYFVADGMRAALPWVLGVVGVWFAISYFANTAMIRGATGARPLARRENPRVYNIVENLTMACGMPMPKVNIIDDPQLNAFASGVDRGSYTVTVTTGLLDLLTDEELSGVIGHELTHIRNRDTRLLVISIIFVGIMGTIMTLAVRLLGNMLLFGAPPRRSGGRKDDEIGGMIGMLLAMVLVVALTAVGYLFTLLTRFAISRKREYMADAGGAELCGDPLALASALRKISGDPALGGVGREDVAQLFIIHPKARRPRGGVPLSGLGDSLFSTHPSTARRIAYLEQF